MPEIARRTLVGASAALLGALDTTLAQAQRGPHGAAASWSMRSCLAISAVLWPKLKANDTSARAGRPTNTRPAHGFMGEIRSVTHQSTKALTVARRRACSGVIR